MIRCLNTSRTGMAVNPQFISGTTGSEAVTVTATPAMTLLYISGQGMVFKSKKPYETGVRLAVGMFLRKIRGDLGMAEHGCTLNGDHFLNLEGMVADCRIVESAIDDRFYQVTLLFEQLGKGDRMLLQAIEEERKSRRRVMSAPKVSAEPMPIGLN